MLTRLRVQQIVIDIPRSESEPWLSLTIQRIEMDENYVTKNIVGRWRQINKRASEFATDIVPYDDPVPVPDGSISGYGLSNAIAAMAISWTAKEYNGTVNELGYIMVDSCL